MSFYHSFRNPPAADRLMPFWFWNDEMDAEEVVYQIQEMAAKGVGGFLICARQGLKLPYLSERWFQLVTLAIETAQQHGLLVWLYDEYPYPSGMSGGEVTLQHPDANQRQLLHQAHIVDGTQTFTCDLPWANVLSAQAIPLEDATDQRPASQARWSQALDLTPSIGIVPAEEVFQSTGLTAYTNKRFFSASPKKQLVWDVPAGRWMIVIFHEKEIEEFKYYGMYVDPCHAEAIQTFITTTYEPYARRFHEYFGKTVQGFFTDEVGLLGHIPWSPRLPAFTREHYEDDIIENLPALLYPFGAKTARIRYQFFQSVHRLLNATYHEQIGKWCADHHLQYTTEVPSMRMTTQLYSHMPGGDSAHEKVGRSLEWILDQNAPSLRADPKIVSSLAHQLGTERAMIECFHSVGWSMTLQDAKWMLDRLAAFDINFFVLHAFFASISGLRKHDAPPSQFLQNPYWPYFNHLAAYAGRLSYALSQGKAHISVAVLHPVTSFWTRMGNPLHNFAYCGNDATEEKELAHIKKDWTDLCKQLVLHQVNFDHLDPELLARTTIEDGQLIIGNARYEVLILPPLTNLEAAAWAQVQAFLQAGGKVVSVGLLPYEQIDQQGEIEIEALQTFGLSTSPRQQYWQTTQQAQGPDSTEAHINTEQDWIKGSQAAYFVPSSSGIQQTQAVAHVLTLLQRLSTPAEFTLEPVTGDLNSFLLQQRSLADGSQLIFITQQEGNEKMLHLHLRQRPARSIVERLDLASGEQIALPVQETAHGWTLPLSFAPYESYLLRYTYDDKLASEIQQASRHTTAGQPWIFTVDVQQPWQLSARENNILRFGSFRFMLDQHNIGLQQGWQDGHSGATWPQVEAKALINQCADVSTMQPLPVQFRQTFGTPMHSSLQYPLHCWYQTSFEISQISPTGQLMMDTDAIGGSYTCYLNGQALEAQHFTLVNTNGYRQQSCDVQSLLRQGTNHLVIHVEAQRDDDGLRDPLYLSGLFGVSLTTPGMPALTQPPATGVPGSDLPSGYPYFAGTLRFMREISLETQPDEKTFALALHGWDKHLHDCVEILVNDHSLGVCCWSPYRWEGESSILHTGTNSIEIRVTNTLSNMLDGSYFDARTHQIVAIDQPLAHS